MKREMEGELERKREGGMRKGERKQCRYVITKEDLHKDGEGGL